MVARSALVVALLMVALCRVQADLPIHCLNIQVTGRWLFEMSSNNNDRYVKCGHKVPDTNRDHFTKKGFDLEVVKKYEVELREPNVAVDTHGNTGIWTMVYDEGFEVIIDKKRFFAFNKYVPKTPESLSKDDVEDYISICDETLVGWFHDDDNTHWGCYHGKKTANLTTTSMRFTGGIKRYGGSSNELNKVLAPSAMALPTPVATQHFRTPTPQGFAQNGPWQPDYAFVEMVNSDKTRTWRATVHRHFIGRRISDMMALLGGRVKTDSDAAHAQIKTSWPRAKVDTRPDHVRYADLPEAFDWRNKDGVNYDSAVKNQGNCGSCYAMATVSAAEARLRIKTKNRDTTSLSSQHVVSCSIYNQGCDGGYPYLVAKHAMDFGLVPDSCMGYTATDGVCSWSCKSNRYYATNYSYIGGYYGGCSEVEMMKEIYYGGPIMVAFDAPSDLFYYSGGIYTGAAPPHEGPKMPNLNWWEKTNHAVVGVGWGVDKGVKYWVIKNTWGADWGESGYFRIRRGTDECGVESMASYMDITLPQSQ